MLGFVRQRAALLNQQIAQPGCSILSAWDTARHAALIARKAAKGRAPRDMGWLAATWPTLWSVPAEWFLPAPQHEQACTGCALAALRRAFASSVHGRATGGAQAVRGRRACGYAMQLRGTTAQAACASVSAAYSRRNAVALCSVSGESNAAATRTWPHCSTSSAPRRPAFLRGRKNIALQQWHRWAQRPPGIRLAALDQGCRLGSVATWRQSGWLRTRSLGSKTHSHSSAGFASLH